MKQVLLCVLLMGCCDPARGEETTPAWLYRHTVRGGRPSLYANALVEDATKTFSAHGRARRGPSSEGIPREFWAERIRALKPVKVYTHLIDVVVVQRVNDGVEEGKYISIPISSHLPQSGKDGFVLSPTHAFDAVLSYPHNGNTLGHGVFDFKRTVGR